MTKYKKSKCILCKKELVTKLENIGRNAITTSRACRQTRTSEEGVCFATGKSNRWFCNKCWELVRK